MHQHRFSGRAAFLLLARVAAAQPSNYVDVDQHPGAPDLGRSVTVESERELRDRPIAEVHRPAAESSRSPSELTMPRLMGGMP
jgi:hypothetical protein